MIINKYIFDIYIFNPWKIFCNLRYHEVFCKTTFIRINFIYLLWTFFLILVVLVLFLLKYVSAKFHFWPSSGD